VPRQGILARDKSSRVLLGLFVRDAENNFFFVIDKEAEI
jgi:hypothetical protein